MFSGFAIYGCPALPELSVPVGALSADSNANCLIGAPLHAFLPSDPWRRGEKK